MQRAWQEYLARMELKVKRVKSAELELPVAKEIQVTRDQMDTLGMPVMLGHLEKKEARVTQAFLESPVLLALGVIQDQRATEDILEIQDSREKKDLWELLDYLDQKARWEGEERLAPWVQKVLEGK